MRVLICSSEVVPFAKTGGLADVAGALPRALLALGHDVRVALPNYSAVNQEKACPERVAEVTVPIPAGEQTAVGILASLQIPGVPTYLIDAPEYFHRDSLYSQPDDPVRFGLFSRAVFEFLRAGEWQPEVIHCNDWQTALIPVWLRTGEYLKDIATLFTIHNFAYQGVFDRAVMDELGLDPGLFNMHALEFFGQVNFMKGALVFSDLLSTVSPTYAKEIQTPEYGERLEGVLDDRAEDLFGVLNGIDYDEWNPATDRYLEAHYDAHDLAGKVGCKTALQRQAGLPEAPEVPLFGLVSRLAGQKGLDLLSDALPHLLEMDVQFVLLGTGEPYYEERMRELAQQFPTKMAAVIGFDNALAHRIYAGSDFFVMPSHYEPCGLGQLISLRYGTIPVVRHTGGLADTITNFNPQTGEGNGFSFEETTAVALLGAFCRALAACRDSERWSRLVQNAMACDFSWDRSAQEYARLYQLAVTRHKG